MNPLLEAASFSRTADGNWFAGLLLHCCFGQACGETMQAAACSYPPLKIISHQRIPNSFHRADHGPDSENLGPAVELLVQMLDVPRIGR
jgi:hypothetical protein